MYTTLQQIIQNAPTAPGCYLYCDKYGNIIYVGKAKNLRRRVRSYFTPCARANERLRDLLPRIAGIQLRQTPTELDALLLEYELIKKYKPWFNRQMKADKARPYLRIGPGGRYPSLSIVPARQEDGAAYYDCFADEQSAKAALALLGQVWRVPQCGKAAFGKPQGPCLYHTLHGCMAPCAGKARAGEYGDAIAEIERFLAGRKVPRLAQLERQMHEYARALAFEQAAALKNQLLQLRRLQQKSRKIYHFPKQGNMLVLVRPYRAVTFSAFFVRGGSVFARANFAGRPGDEAVRHFVAACNAAAAPLGGQVADALLAISAHKAFVPLPGRLRPAVFKKAVHAFCTRGQGVPSSTLPQDKLTNHSV